MRVHTANTRQLRIKELLSRLDSGVDVQARDLKIVLGEEKYSEFQRRWDEQKELRCIEKPSDVVVYEGLLKKALFCYAKYDKFSLRPSASNRIIINHKEKVDKLKILRMLLLSVHSNFYKKLLGET